MALTEHVLHRLPETEVDAQRERGNELRQPNMRTISLAGHTARLPPREHAGRTMQCAQGTRCDDTLRVPGLVRVVALSGVSRI
jgi:hypothetical protein